MFPGCSLDQVGGKLVQVGHEGIVLPVPASTAIYSQGMEQNPTLLEAAKQALRKAQERFAEDPSDANVQSVQQAQNLVVSARDLERRDGPARTPSQPN